MQNLSIRQVLGLLFVVPILCVGISLWQLAPAALHRMGEARNLDRAISLAQVAGTLVHGLQMERGTSLAFLSGSDGDAALLERLAKARAAVDTARKDFDDAVNRARADNALPKAMIGYADMLSQRSRDHAEMRGRVDKYEAKPAEAIAFYSKFIGEIIDNGTTASGLAVEESVDALRGAHQAVIHAKESAGIQRAAGVTLLSGGKIDPIVYERFISVVATQRYALHSFGIALGADSKALFDRFVSLDLQSTHEQAEGAIMAAAREGGWSPMAPEQWFATATDRVNGMYALERHLAERLHAAAEREGQQARNQLLITAALQGLAVLIGLGLTAWIGHMLATPIRSAAQALERAASGDLSVQAPAPMTGKGEIGLISNAVGAFIAANVERARLINEREQAEKAMGETRTRVLGQMETEFNSASKQATDMLQEAAHTLNAKSAAMMSTVGAVRQAQDEAYAAAEDSRGTVSEVTRLSEELAQSISEIAQQSARTAKLASEVQGRAQASREAATQFEDVAQAIGSIVDLINAIAGQTNLLALNATIEAARAGDAGKGFAVVAGEVKDLAARTMDATRTIESKVTELKDIARDAAAQATALSDDVGDIQGLNSAVAAAVHQQHMTSESFIGSIQSLAGTVNAMVEHVDTIARLGSDAQTSAASVQDVANEMEATTATLAETLPRLIADTSKRIAG